MTFGKICGGMLLDRLWPFAVAAAITTLAAAGVLGLSLIGPTSAYLVIGMMIAASGVVGGAAADFLAFFALRSFERRALGMIVGLLATMTTLGMTTGAWLFGAIFDSTGSYAAALLLGRHALRVRTHCAADLRVSSGALVAVR